MKRLPEFLAVIGLAAFVLAVLLNASACDDRQQRLEHRERAEERR